MGYCRLCPLEDCVSLGPLEAAQKGCRDTYFGRCTVALLFASRLLHYHVSWRLVQADAVKFSSGPSIFNSDHQLQYHF